MFQKIEGKVPRLPLLHVTRHGVRASSSWSYHGHWRTVCCPFLYVKTGSIIHRDCQNLTQISRPKQRRMGWPSRFVLKTKTQLDKTIISWETNFKKRVFKMHHAGVVNSGFYFTCNRKNFFSRCTRTAAWRKREKRQHVSDEKGSLKR